MQDENLVSTPSSPVLESAQSAAATLVKNTLYFLASSTIVSILSFIFNVFVVRRLGDERYGLYNTALAYAAIFSIIGDLGMTQYVTREIARGRKTAAEMFWNVACVRLILAAVATLFITLSAAFIADYEPTMVWGIFLLCLSYFIFAFFIINEPLPWQSCGKFMQSEVQKRRPYFNRISHGSTIHFY